MAKESYPEKLDNKIFDAILRLRKNIMETYPEDAMIDSILRASYVGMQPEQQLQIVEQLGPDWMVEIAAKLEKKLTQIDKQGVS
jgi:hypothetical protein|tara:strand:- start:51 stop:302 length:252 start_codon:yes stop_codon:yes gene_type:complete